MKLAAVIPVKRFAAAKSRLALPQEPREELCRMMLDEVLHAASVSPRIDGVVVVTGEEEAAAMCRRRGGDVVFEAADAGVNAAVAAADARLEAGGYDASLVMPQDIPYVMPQDIDFVMGHARHPSFAIVVPSRRFDGTNALARMPVGLMGTHYDEDSYRAHMREAGRRTPNAATVFARRMMWDVDTLDDLRFLLGTPLKPGFAARASRLLEECGS